MKKGKVLGKNQAILALMVVALGAAVWLNMKFTSTEKYLGEATYVSDSVTSSEAVATSAKAQKETDYFEDALSDREEALKEAQEAAEETLKSAELSDEDKQKALESVNKFVSHIEKANSIETLLKAKGFKRAVAVIGDSDISVIVKSDGLTTTQTLQIQDIVTSQTDISLGNIKIITVK